MAVPTAIVTERLLLNPLAEADLPDIMHLANNPEIAAVTLNIPYPYTEASARFWLELGARGRREGNRHLFAIRKKDTHQFMGGIEIMHNQLHQKGVLGYWIGEPYWGAGYMTEAVRAIIAFGFGALAMQRIEATHLCHNPASGRVMEKAGMRHEGLLRSFYVKDGQPVDVHAYVILRGDQEA